MLEFTRKKKKGQISLEYLLLLGGLFVIVIILFVLFSNYIIGTSKTIDSEPVKNFVQSSQNNQIIYDIITNTCIQRPLNTGLNYTFLYNGDVTSLSFIAFNLDVKGYGNNNTINCSLSNSTSFLELRRTQLDSYNSLFETSSQISFSSSGLSSFKISCWNEKNGTKIKVCGSNSDLSLSVLGSFPYSFVGNDLWPKFRLNNNGNPSVSLNSSVYLGSIWNSLFYKKDSLNVTRASGGDVSSYAINLLWTCKPEQQFELVYSNYSSKGVVYASCYADLAYSLNDSTGTQNINLTDWNVSSTFSLKNYLNSLLNSSLLVGSLNSFNGSINWINNYFGFTNVSSNASYFGKIENYSYVKGQLSPVIYKDYLALFGWNRILRQTNGAFGPNKNDVGVFRSNYTRLMLVNKSTGSLSCAVNFSAEEFNPAQWQNRFYALVGSNSFFDTSTGTLQVNGLSERRILGTAPWINPSITGWGINPNCTQRFSSGTEKGASIASNQYDLIYSTNNSGFTSLNSSTYYYAGMDSGAVLDDSAKNVAYFFNNDCRMVAFYPSNQTLDFNMSISTLIKVINATNGINVFNLTSCGQFVSEPVLWNNTILIATSFQRPSFENKTIFDGYSLDLNTTKVVAINVSSQNVVWFYPNVSYTNSSNYTFNNYGSVLSRSSPIVYNDSLVIIKVAKYYDSSGYVTKNNTIVALNLTNGKEVWNFDLNSNNELVNYNWDSVNVNRPLGVIVQDKLYLREADYNDVSLSDKTRRPVLILWANNGSRASTYVTGSSVPLSTWNSLISASNFLYYPTDIVSNDSTYFSFTRNVNGVNYTSIQALGGNTTVLGGQDGSDISFISATTTDNSGSQPSLVYVGGDVNESLAYNYTFFVHDLWTSINDTSCNVTINGIVYPATKYDNYVQSPLFQVNKIQLNSISGFYDVTVTCKNALNWITNRSQKIYAYPAAGK